MALVTGGASSGKSAFAERLALALPGPHVYAATMRHGDAESEARIARHVKARAGKSFRTVELACGARIDDASACTVLLDDLSNYVLNGLQDQAACLQSCENVVIVSNEIGCDGGAYDRFTVDFIESLGALSCTLAARADLVVEVIAGLPIVVKGRLPWTC